MSKRIRTLVRVEKSSISGNYSVKKVSDLILFRKPGGFGRDDLEPSYPYVNFSPLSIASADGKQHFSEVVLRLFSDKSKFYSRGNEMQT